MAKITVNSTDADIQDGTTLMKAARDLGFDVPSMCAGRKGANATSCMVCVVRDVDSGRLLPACTATVSEVQAIDTECDEVKQARKAALELLLSDHTGDCEGPCRTGCPTFMNIPLMIRYIASGALDKAIGTIKEHIALPAVLGRICPAPCEKACRRKRHDDALAICALKRFAADTDLSSDKPFQPRCEPDSGRRVAVVGAGPAGLSAAYYLKRLGHSVVLFDRRDRAGGALRYSVPEEQLDRKVLDAEIDGICRLGIQLRTNTELGKDVSLDELRGEFDAVILATGSETSIMCPGIDRTDAGVAVDRISCRTSVEGVFAAGGVVKQTDMVVRACGDGRRTAYSADAFLRGREYIPERHNSVSRMGALQEGELSVFLEGASCVARMEVGAEGFSADEAKQEGARCLHCDCRKADTCKLRQYADLYQARQSRYKPVERRIFEQVRSHRSVIYEPGKCIKCGLCVRITENAGEKLGLTFLGRGFDVRVGVPFNESLEEALEKVAEQCVRTCPTGSLAFKENITL